MDGWVGTGISSDMEGREDMRVVIEVDGGIARVLEKPAGVEVIIKDYDVDDLTDDDIEGLGQDGGGRYSWFEYEKDLVIHGND